MGILAKAGVGCFCLLNMDSGKERVSTGPEGTSTDSVRDVSWQGSVRIPVCVFQPMMRWAMLCASSRKESVFLILYHEGLKQCLVLSRK